MSTIQTLSTDQNNIADPVGSAEDQFFANEDLRASHATDIRILRASLTQQEHTMDTDTQTTYDSGLADPESPLAEQIDAVGIEVVAATVIEATGSSVREDDTDPGLDGYTPVLDAVLALAENAEEVGEALAALRLNIIPSDFGEPNPHYITQVWLDEDGPEWIDRDNKLRKSPTQVIFGFWLGGAQVASAYCTDERQPGEEYAFWTPRYLRTFRTETELRAHLREMRPGQSAAERAERAVQVHTVGSRLAELLGVPTAADDIGF